MTTENQVATQPQTNALALITLQPEQYVAEVFGHFEKELEAVTPQAQSAQFDITTTAGMKTAIEYRATLRSIRVDAEKARKERKAPILEIGRLLDAKYKELEAKVTPLESKFDDAIKAEEQRKAEEKRAAEEAERQRIATIKDYLEGIRENLTDALHIDRTVKGAQDSIAHLEKTEVTQEFYQEFYLEALSLKEQTMESLRKLLAERIAAEEEAKRVAAEREELARMRAEMEARRQERLRVEAEEAMKRDVEAKRIEAELQAEREKLDAQRELLAQEARRVLAEREALERAQQEKAEAERIAMLTPSPTPAQAHVADPIPAEDVAFVANFAEPLVIDTKTADLFDQADAAAPATDRPSDDDILNLIAVEYNVTTDKAMEWLVEMVIFNTAQ